MYSLWTRSWCVWWWLKHIKDVLLFTKKKVKNLDLHTWTFFKISQSKKRVLSFITLPHHSYMPFTKKRKRHIPILVASKRLQGQVPLQGFSRRSDTGIEGHHLSEGTWKMRSRRGCVCITYDNVDGSEIRKNNQLILRLSYYPMFHRISYVTGGAGVRPSTVRTYTFGLPPTQ